MFGSKVKKIAAELSPAIRNHINLSFFALDDKEQFIDYSTTPYTVQLPSKFFDDDYILGWTQGTLMFLLKAAFGPANLSSSQAGEVMMRVWRSLDSSNGIEYLKTATDNVKLGKLDSDNAFSRGFNDAATLVGVTFGTLRSDDQDPVLLKAKQHAISLKQVMAETGQMLGLPDDPNAALIEAVRELTIHKHIAETYF